MFRKATWSVLLLLLVSTQVLAATCEVRCSVEPADSGCHTSGAAHGRNTAVVPSVVSHTAATIASGSLCDDDLCHRDWAFVQAPAPRGLTVSPLAMEVIRPVSASFRVAQRPQFRSARIRGSCVFDRLIPNLRV